MKIKCCLFLVLALTIQSFTISTSSEKNLSGLMVSDTLPWSQRMAQTLMIRFPQLWKMEERNHPVWSYTYGLVGMSFEKLYLKTGNNAYYDYAKAYADEMINDKGKIKTYDFTDYNLDEVNSGKMLFILFDKTGEQKYKIAIDTLRKQLSGQPRTSFGGFWHKARYPHQMWLLPLWRNMPVNSMNRRYTMILLTGL